MKKGKLGMIIAIALAVILLPVASIILWPQQLRF